MECKEFEILISGSIDRENTAEEECRLQKHLASCPRCRALLSDYAAISKVIGDLSEEPPEALLNGVMAQIRSPVRKRRFLFGGGTLAAAAVIALAFALPRLALSDEAPAAAPAAFSSSDETNRKMVRNAGARFAAAEEPLLIEITDDPELPAAQNAAPLNGLPYAMTNGNPEYYVDAAAAREIIDACSHYAVAVPDGLSSAADTDPCIVRIVMTE